MPTLALRPRPPRLWLLVAGAAARLVIAVSVFAAVILLAVVCAIRADTVALVVELAVGVPLYRVGIEAAARHARYVLGVLRTERRRRAAARLLAAVAARRAALIAAAARRVDGPPVGALPAVVVGGAR